MTDDRGGGGPANKGVPANWGRLTWVTTKQAAAYLQVHPRTLSRYAAKGLISSHGIKGRPGLVRYRREDVEGLVEPHDVEREENEQ